MASKYFGAIPPNDTTSTLRPRSCSRWCPNSKNSTPTGLEKETNKEELNAIIKKYAMEGDLVEQIQYSINNELVSSDIVGTSAPSIYDSNATIVAKNGKSVVLYVWYDNEYGYSHQVIRLAKYISKVRRFTYY